MPVPLPPPPPTIEALMASATPLAGRSLRWIAERHGLAVPPDLRRHKGWVGHLLERVLGASAGGRAEPDFPHLGVELKTLPVDARGKPRESTWVCTARMDGTIAKTWEDSWVLHKLAHVLWIPIVVAADQEVGDRTVGAPILWRPSAEEEAVLAADWRSLTEIIALGQLWQLNARHGTALQVRPKAASARDLTWVLDEENEWVQDSPRGFYLRTSFTAEMVRQHLRLPRQA